MNVGEFGGNVPFTLSEIVDAVNEVAKGERTVCALQWVRITAPPFDLYADLFPPAPEAEPVAGVFLDDIDSAHIVDLYHRTSGRYVFPPWLREALALIRSLDAGTCRKTKDAMED